MKTDKEKSFIKFHGRALANFEKLSKSHVYVDMDFEDLIRDTLLNTYKKFETLTNEKNIFLSFFSASVFVFWPIPIKKSINLNCGIAKAKWLW
jgi:hypothetical protein